MEAILVAQNGDGGPIGALEAPLREAGFGLETWHAPRDGAAPDPRRYAGVIALGGVANPDEDGRLPWLAEERRLVGAAAEQGVPVLGLCLGAQLLAQATGGAAPFGGALDLGWRQVELTREGEEDGLLAVLPRSFTAFQWHRYGLQPPPGAAVLAGGSGHVQAFRVGERAWGLQFHLEVDAAILHHWFEVAPHEVEAAGESIDDLRRRTGLEAAASVERAHAVAGCFAQLLGPAGSFKTRAGCGA
jgi:GMP synthase (glutamine-hydrolysing)